MTLDITAFTTGAEGIDYPLSGGDCCDHHGHEGPEQYYAKGAGQDPVGIWWGAGLASLGLTAGAVVDEADARSVFGYLTDPRAAREAMEEAIATVRAQGLKGAAAHKVRQKAAEEADARLGSKPYQYKTYDERVAARIKKLIKEGVDPEQEPEKVKKIEQEEAKRTAPKSRYFYDLTFTPSKSSSIFYAALLGAGREDEAELMRRCHKEAVEEALRYLQDEAGYARAGTHKKAKDDRPSIGRWVDAHEWIVGMWDHLTNREAEPHLHTHAVLLNRVLAMDGDEQRWLAVDGQSLFRAKKAAAAIYERGFEQRVQQHWAVAYAMRPDGKAREIVGISPKERAALSTRRAQTQKLLDEWVAKWKKEHGGAEPGPYVLAEMSRDAATQTKKAKQRFPSRAALVESWQRLVGDRLNTTLGEIADRAEAAGIEARAEGDTEPWELRVVLLQALKRVQEKMSTWTRSDLIFAINEILPDRLGPALLSRANSTRTLLEELADEALSGRYGTVMTRGMELFEVPEELRRADGRSIYRPGRDERYALVSHMAQEQAIEARARQVGAKALTSEQIEAVLQRLATTTGQQLGEDQADAVWSVLGGSRWVDVIVGPAGTGKSRTQGVIADAWEAFGGRVIGLAPSSKAAQVLLGEGLKLATNTAKFLERAAGRGPKAECELYRLRPGDLVILDEAGMANTPDMHAVAELAEEAGAKLVVCGDHGQLASVGAGGVFAQLVEKVGAVELGTVRRYRNADGSVREWEAQASLGLRQGRLEAAQAYLDRGLIRSGTAEEMAEAIRRFYVADVLRGDYSVVLTSTEDKAAELAGSIRADLVRLGRVEATGVQLADGTMAGVGDLVQARNNLNRLKDSEGMPVYNRYMYRVLARHQDGALTVQRVKGRDDQGQEVLGGRVRLKAGYVAEHVRLGYAGTTHSAQGDTVTKDYGLLDKNSTREQAYVALGRGWQENRGFVVVDEEDEGVLDVLAQILARRSAQDSASTVLAGELDWIESLGAHAPVWADLVEQHQRGRFGELLRATLGGHYFARLEAEDPVSVYRQLWGAEVAGHDVAALLQETSGTMKGARSVPAVLYTRIQTRLNEREPERAPLETWQERTPELAGAVGEYVQVLARAMDERTAALGARAVAAPPVWAVERLGAVPEEPVARAQWEQRVAAVEAYRELQGLEDGQDLLGAPPAPTMVVEHAAWQAAQQALGRTPEEVRLAELPEGHLRDMVAIWERELEWAPRDVTQERTEVDWRVTELQETLAHVEDQARRAVRPEVSAFVAGTADGQAAELETAVSPVLEVDGQASVEAAPVVAVGPDLAVRPGVTAFVAGQATQLPAAVDFASQQAVAAELAERAAQAREQLAEATAQATALEQAYEERTTWYRDVTEVRETAEAARAELRRRQADQPERDGDERQAEETKAAERELSEQERARAVFERLADRMAGKDVEGPEHVAEVETAERELSEQDRARELFEQLAADWAAERDGEERPLNPRVSQRAIDEVREAAEQQVSVRERTVRGLTLTAGQQQAPAAERAQEQVQELAAEQERARQSMEALADRMAAEVAAEQAAEQVAEVASEPDSQQITREHHYAQERQAELAAPQQAAEAELGR
ncbi:MobF family relaxase [Nonomuraea sp. WAC 01424]|uniref:MobF family relaxase n=1 Tax=Nonomuraea sp. WAC 01424 TaxID=2203200 RepID=UPI000F7901B3|nr:MobF family relaxase [Nonomuraea sp. WAC 01424]